MPRHVLILDATYQCNDHCDFCFNQKQVNHEPGLTLAAIKKNYAYVRKQYPLEQIIISGGEPTLHPEFWQLMEFLHHKTNVSISLNTNSLLFSQPAYLKRYGEILARLTPARRATTFISLSLSNVDHYPPKTPKERLKLQGLLQLLTLAWQHDIKPLVVIAVTKTNYRVVPQLTQAIIRHYRKQAHGKPLSLTLRGLYLDHFMTSAQKELTVPGWKIVQPYVTDALKKLVREPRITVKLFNLPLCYFRQLPVLKKLTLSLQKFPSEMRAKLNYAQQYAKIRFTKFHGDTWDLPTCHDCVLTAVCNKIQPEFLTDYRYPPLQPF